MAESIGIEYVCNGNNGRSPMAEAIARQYLDFIELEDRFTVTSSGSGLSVVTMGQGDFLKRQKIKIAMVRTGYDNGLFRKVMGAKARAVVEGGMNADEKDIDRCFRYVVQAEATFRNMALFDKGYFADGQFHKPTEPRADVHLILPMTQQNTRQVREIYAGSGFSPIIVPLNAYAGMPGEVPNPFCQLLPAYEKTRDHLMQAVPKTIDRAIKEFGV